METPQIHGAGPPFAFSTAAVLGMDSYKSQSLAELYNILLEENVHVGSVIYVGDGNLFLTLASKPYQNGSVMFRCGVWADQGSC
jgi:hypothetical protein